MLIHNINLKYDHETKLHLWLSQFHGCPSPPPPGRLLGLCHLVGEAVWNLSENLWLAMMGRLSNFFR